MNEHNQEKDQKFIDFVSRGLLLVTPEGVVVNPKTGRRLGYKNNRGYWAFSFQCPDTKKIYCMMIHRLVWIVFKGPVPLGFVVNHKDEDRLNACLNNLELITENDNRWYSRHAKDITTHLKEEAEWSRLRDLGHTFKEIKDITNSSNHITSIRTRIIAYRSSLVKDQYASG